MRAVMTTTHRASVAGITVHVFRLGDRQQGRVDEQYRSMSRASARLAIDQEDH